MRSSNDKLTSTEEDALARQDLLNHSFVIVIPAYNEEKRIGSVLDDICGFIQRNKLPWRVIVSIDGNDGTEEIVSRFSRIFGFVTALKNKARSGYGGAIKKGILNGEGEYAMVLEADGAMDLTDVIRNLHFLKEYDIINFDRHSGNERNIPFIRRFASRGYNIYIKLLFGLNIKDIQGGYKVFRMKTVKSLFRRITITDGFFQAALFFHAKKMELKVIEVNVPYRHQQGSKFGMGHMIFGGFISGIALRVRYSPFFRFIPKSFVGLYYKKFRWI